MISAMWGFVILGLATACKIRYRQNGDPCDDGDLCTVNDTCDNGTCSGAVKDCSSLDDQCNLGACDPGTGNCIQNPSTVQWRSL